MISPKDSHSLSEFQRNAQAHVEHLKKTGRPEVLTVHGQAAIVGIQRGLRGMYEGTGEDAEDAFASLERELGIPEQGVRDGVRGPVLR